MELDYKALQFWLQTINTLGLFVVGIYSWLSNRHKASESAITAMKDTIVEDRTSIEARFARLESEIKHLPTHNDMGAIYERVNEVSETLSELEGQLKLMNQTLQMINEHLLRAK